MKLQKPRSVSIDGCTADVGQVIPEIRISYKRSSAYPSLENHPPDRRTSGIPSGRAIRQFPETAVEKPKKKKETPAAATFRSGPRKSRLAAPSTLIRPAVVRTALEGNDCPGEPSLLFPRLSPGPVFSFPSCFGRRQPKQAGELT